MRQNSAWNVILTKYEERNKSCEFIQLLRSCCYKKEQKNKVLGDIVCLDAKGHSPVERENLIIERRGTNFWSNVLD